MVAPLWVATMDVRSAYWQFSISAQHMVESSTLNPYMSLFNLKLCTHIWSTNINFSSPLHWTIGPSWSELSPYRWIARGWGVEGVDWASDTFFCHGEKRDYLSSNVWETRLKTIPLDKFIYLHNCKDFVTKFTIFTEEDSGHSCSKFHYSTDLANPGNIISPNWFDPVFCDHFNSKSNMYIYSCLQCCARPTAWIMNAWI